MILNHLKHLFKATSYTCAGLKVAVKQTAFQQELLLAIPHIFLICWLKIQLVYALILSILWVTILAAELLNTGIEAIVDLASPGIHPLAKIAKDTASAAVGCLLFAFFAAWTAVIVLG